MRQAPKMTDLVIEETSGVDHPAHLHEGWLVVKTANVESEADVLRALPEPMEEGMAEDETPEVEDTPADDTPAEAPAEAAEPVEAAADGEMPEDGEDSETEDELAMAQARITELEARIAELEGMLSQKEGTDDEAESVEDAAESEDEAVALAKAAPEPLRKMLADLQKAKTDAENALRKEREDRADAEAVAKARDTFKNLTLDPEKIGPALRRLTMIDADLAKAVEDALVSADAQNESANIFAEVGKQAAPNSGTAYAKMVSLAKAAVAEGKVESVQQGIALVASEDPALYTEYLTEKGA